VIPNRLVVSGHIREKLALVSDGELGLGTCGKALGQLDCGATTLLVEDDRGIDIDGRSEGLGVERGTAQSEIGRVESELCGILEDIEAWRGVSGFYRRLE